MATQHIEAAAYRGYFQREEGNSDIKLTQVGPGTPGGEYMRRFWQVVAYERELGELPLRIRALGEDLVAFKDGRGAEKPGVAPVVEWKYAQMSLPLW